MRLGPLLLGFGILVIDAISKFWVDGNLPPMAHFSKYPYGGIGIFQNFLGIEFSITHLTNKGAAWGAFGDYQFPLLLLRIALIGGMIIYILNDQRQKQNPWPLLFIIAGAIGNVVDYFVYGHVVDMFHFIFWGFDFAVFNVADAAVTVGITWLIALSLFQTEKPQVAE